MHRGRTLPYSTPRPDGPRVSAAPGILAAPWLPKMAVKTPLKPRIPCLADGTGLRVPKVCLPLAEIPAQLLCHASPAMAADASAAHLCRCRQPRRRLALGRPGQQGDVWGVVAPAVMPHKAGARVNTDRRDAMHLARLRRSRDLTPIDVRTGGAEAIRDLRRARDQTRHDLPAAQWHLNAVWRRHESRSTGRTPGRPAHGRWLSAVDCHPQRAAPSSTGLAMNTSSR